MRTPLVVGNWKLNHGPKATEEFLKVFLSQPFPSIDVGIAPPFVSIPKAADVRSQFQKPLILFGQNVSPHDSGAYTGEVSVLMLKEAGAHGTILGHSERRQIFGETNDSVHLKLVACLKYGFYAILCIGETLEQREKKQTLEICKTQLQSALQGLKKADFSNLVIAYEPVWAIGTGRNATPEQAEEVHAFIREWLWDTFHKDVASDVRVIYGGSVKPENAESLIKQPNIDGFLVGGASLKVTDFVSIIQSALKRRAAGR